MREQIEKLENQLKELKEAYNKEQKESYENKKHKHFEKGDLVIRGTEIGIVSWTENKTCNTPYEKGYMGVSLVSGNRGFLGFAKRDEWDLLEDPYYKTKHLVKIELTGLEIDRLIYDLGGRNINPSDVKSKFIDVLDEITNKP